MNEPNYALMRDIEERYQKASGLTDRRYYSLFYGPLVRFPIAVINENPGGSPDNFQIVDVMAGQHELIEGRYSGRTTNKTADLMLRLMDRHEPGALRSLQLFNQHFRRSPGKAPTAERRRFVAEAAPFLLECLAYTAPRLILFAGAGEPPSVMARIGGSATEDEGRAVMGPHSSGSSMPYYREFQIEHPDLGSVVGIGMIHARLWNYHFEASVVPLLQEAARRALHP